MIGGMTREDNGRVVEAAGGTPAENLPAYVEASPITHVTPDRSS